MRFRYLSSLLMIIAVAAIYFIAAELGLSMASVHTNVSPVWPPTGVALAAVLWLGYRISPGIMLGAFLANLATDVSIATASAIAIGNTSEAVSAAFLIHRFIGFRSLFDRAQDVLKFVIIAGVLSTTLSATIGNLSLCLSGAASWANFGSLWLTWWLGDGAGALVVAPLLLTWIEKRQEQWSSHRLLEAALLLLSLSAVATIIFRGTYFTKTANYPIEHLTIPFLLWAAFRFNQRGATTSANILSGIAVWGTTRGLGPFARESPNESLLLLQVFVGAVTVTALILAAVVTERKRAEEALRESERRFRQLAENINEVFWVSDPHTPEILYISPGYKEVWGRECESLYERPSSYLDAIHPDDRGRVLKALEKQIQGEYTDEEYRVVRPDGSICWVRDRGFPIKDASRKVYRIAGIAVNITGRKQEEEEREKLLAREKAARIEAEQAQKLSIELLQREQAARAEAEVANRAKDLFLANISHELRTPLNAILGWAGMLRTGKLDKAIFSQALEIIERNAKAQTQLINDILDVSRIVTGKLRLEVRPVELSSVLQAAIDVIRPAANAKEISLQVVLDPRAGPISGDPDRLQQIVWNLLSNAVKFTPQGGQIQVCLERVNSHVEITISDSGIGISADFLPHVFDRFRQADSSYTRAYSGLGLGLAIVRHLVELHGGAVQAFSSGEGKGATFKVKLPLIAVYHSEDFLTGAMNSDRAQPAEAAGAEFNFPSALDGLRLLVVDDDSDARKLLSLMLSRCGAEVTAAATASEALASIEQAKPDLLISDIEMPGEDGYSLIHKIRSSDAKFGGHIPAIALTAHARAEDRLRALSAGFQSHVAKPVSANELIAVIVSLIGRSSKV